MEHVKTGRVYAVHPATLLLQELRWSMHLQLRHRQRAWVGQSRRSIAVSARLDVISCSTRRSQGLRAMSG